jgi:hypothetical protein
MVDRTTAVIAPTIKSSATATPARISTGVDERRS